MSELRHYITDLYPEERRALEALADIYPNTIIRIVNGHTDEMIATYHPDYASRYRITLRVFEDARK